VLSDEGEEGRALRRRATLIFAGCSGVPVPSRMTVIRRESAPSRIASSGPRGPYRIPHPRFLQIVPTFLAYLHEFLLPRVPVWCLPTAYSAIGVSGCRHMTAQI
jgi:hypothetical protein